MKKLRSLLEAVGVILLFGLFNLFGSFLNKYIPSSYIPIISGAITALLNVFYVEYVKPVFYMPQPILK